MLTSGVRCLSRHGYAERRMHASRPDPGSDAVLRWLRGLPEDRSLVGAPARMHDLWARWVLRLIAQSPCLASRQDLGTSDLEVVRARRGLDVVLRRRGRAAGSRVTQNFLRD